MTAAWLAALLTALPTVAQTPSAPAPVAPPPISPPPLSAQPTPEPANTPGATTDEALARAHYEKGTAAYALGDFAEAARQYETAFRLKLDPALLYNAAQAHRRAGNRQRAIELYLNLLRVFPDAPNRQLARQHLDELRRQSDDSRGTAGVVPSPSPAGGAENPGHAGTAARGVQNAVPPVALDQTVPADSGATPLLHRPWFWVAVGTVVAAGAVTVGLLASRDRAARPSWGTVGQ